MTDQTYYRWRREYGGLKVSQAKRLKDLERENGRLKKLVAELSLDKAMLQEAENTAYLAHIAAADSAIQANDASTARRQLAEAPQHLRNWEWFFLQNRIDSSRTTLRVSAGAQNRPPKGA